MRLVIKQKFHIRIDYYYMFGEKMKENLEPNEELDLQTQLPFKTHTWKPHPASTAQVKAITPDDIFQYMLTNGLNPLKFKVALEDDYVYIIPEGYLGDKWKFVATLFVGDWISESTTNGYWKVSRRLLEYDIHILKQSRARPSG